MRQALVDRAGHGESADAGIEDADGCGVHRTRKGIEMLRADAARHRLQLEVGREVGEVARDVGLEAGAAGG